MVEFWLTQPDACLDPNLSGRIHEILTLRRFNSDRAGLAYGRAPSLPGTEVLGSNPSVRSNFPHMSHHPRVLREGGDVYMFLLLAIFGHRS